MQTLSLQCCNAPVVGILANAWLIDEPRSDRELIEALIAWSGGKSASQLARTAKLTPSTLTRPLNQDVNFRLSTPTIEKLKRAYPAFPAFARDPDLPETDPAQDYLPVSIMPTYAGQGGGGFGDDDPQERLAGGWRAQARFF